jgi:hypothetical protein
MMNANVMHRILVLGASLLFVSCTGIGSWDQRADCLVVPIPVGDLPDDVDLRARMRFSVEGREAHFEVIARRVSEELVVVGIAQSGVRLFAIHQRGREIALKGNLSRKSEHLARWTMDALHRALWISPPPDAGAGLVVNWRWESEVVTDTIDDERRRRKFVRPGESDSVLIRYLSPAAEAGDRVEIQNFRCGYEATFVVVETSERLVR